MEAHVVLGEAVTLKNTVKAVESNRVNVKSLVLQSLASAEATLTGDEREMGVVFVDMGGNYQRGHIPRAHQLEFYYGALDFNEVRLSQIIDRHQELVIYDYHGQDGYDKTHATAQAVYWGFEKVYYFADGLPGWEAAGFPVEAGD